MRAFLACLAAATALAVPASAGAATIVVDTTEPQSTTECGLVNAINAANSNSVSGGCRGGSFGSPDLIEFELPPRATIMLGIGLPTILGPLDVVGPGTEQLLISGGDVSRIFTVASPAASISDLTIADGAAERAGGVSNELGSTLELARVTLDGNEVTLASTYGGAIQNEGTLTLSESTVSENVARSFGLARGGGIANMGGTMTIVRSTIVGNEAIGTGAGNALGGGVYSSGQLTIRESTLSGNRTVAAGAPGVSQGGAVLAAGGAATIVASTFTGNSAASAANVYGGTLVSLRSTIVAGPLGGGANCEEAVVSLGFNLEQGNSCGLAQPSDQANVDPLLAPLAANGGATETAALLPGSPALDRGLAVAGEGADQRGLPRPVVLAGVPSAPGGNGADVGAYELQAPRAAIVRGPAAGETVSDPEPSFEFVADEAGASFQCVIDDAVQPCTSPFRTPKLGDGPHTFSVFAVGALGYGQPAATRSFAVAIHQPEPRRDVPAPPRREEPPQTIVPAAPRATIAALPATTTKRRLTIRFAANQAGSSFACKLDGRKWRGCRSPYRTPQLALGRHTFRVKATGPTGVLNPTPVVKSFRVIAPPRRR